MAQRSIRTATTCGAEPRASLWQGRLWWGVSLQIKTGERFGSLSGRDCGAVIRRASRPILGLRRQWRHGIRLRDSKGRSDRF